MAVEKKDVVKAAETKAPAAAAAPAVPAAPVVKAEEKAPAAVKKPAAKKPAVKKEAVKKEPVKKETVKKAAEKTATAAKKPAAKKADPKANVVVEFDGKQILAKDILAAATKAFTKANKGVAIKTIDIYVKPEEHAAYYVVNGQGSEDYKVML